jgi:hypothetical protein
MNFTSQSVAQAPNPVLHITHRQRQQAGPAGAPPFSWYLCPQAGAFRHLVLVAGHEPLVHWVLPATGLGLAEPTPGLWLQVAPDLDVALPVADQASCHGTAWAVGRAAASCGRTVEQLMLQLPASPEGTRQVYWLRQLQPGSASWLLSQERPASCL